RTVARQCLEPARGGFGRGEVRAGNGRRRRAIGREPITGRGARSSGKSASRGRQAGAAGVARAQRRGSGGNGTQQDFRLRSWRAETRPADPNRTEPGGGSGNGFEAEKVVLLRVEGKSDHSW